MVGLGKYDSINFIHLIRDEIFGLDVLLDSKFRVHLLEINAGPSLSIDGVEEVDPDYEPAPSEKVCRCMKNPHPHIHKISTVDTLIKSVVVQGALSIMLDIEHSSKVMDVIY